MNRLILKLQERRKELNETQEQFASRLGITQSMLSLIEDGKAGIGDQTRRGIVSAFPDLKDDVVADVLNPEVARQNV